MFTGKMTSKNNKLTKNEPDTTWWYIRYNSYLKSLMSPDVQEWFPTRAGHAFITHVINKMKLIEDYPGIPKYFTDTLQEFKNLYSN